MSIGDAELLALNRSGVRPPAAVWAVLAAIRDVSNSRDTLTIGLLMEHTGYDRATVYRAREWLDESAPGWRGAAEVVATNGNGNGHKPGVALELAPVAAVEVLPPLAPAPSITPPKQAGPKWLTWRDCLDRAHQAVTGKRTWDLFHDIYSPTADELFEKGSIGDLIALTVHYAETVIGGKVTAGERKRIAQVVRIHGKAIIYGMQEGLARTDEPGCAGAITYATAVAQSTHRKIRAKESTA